MQNSIQIQPSIDLQWLKEFVQQKVMPQAQERNSKAQFAWDLYKELHKQGWMHAVLPTNLGGKALTVSDMIWVIKELAYGSAGVATTVMANLLGYSPMALYGPKKLQENIFLNSKDKLALWSFAMTEASAGFNIMNTQTTAKKVSNGYLISGTKDYITNATYAEHLSVFANVIDSTGKSLGITAFYIPSHTPGVSRGPAMNKLGQRESNAGQLIFNNVFVPDDYLLGQIGEGLKILHHSLGRTKTLIGAIANGLCLRALDLAIAHLKTRKHTSNRTLFEKSSIQQFLAYYHTQIDAGWLLTCLSAATWDSGSLAIREACQAKMFSGDTAVRFTGEALELVGAQGYSEDHEISRLYKDAKLLEIYEGSTQILEILIAKEIFKSQLAQSQKLKVA